VDILTSITGVSFAAALPAHVEVTYGDVRVPVIGRETLVQNKLAL